MRSMVRAAAVAAAFGVVGFAGVAPASALVCKQHSHTADATGSFETLTSLKARAAWRYEVQQHEGVSWTLWRLAKFKTTKCSKAGSSGKWTCVSRARPCKTGS
jgi:hypothetical protein